MTSVARLLQIAGALGLSLLSTVALAQSFSETILPLTGDEQSLIVTNTSGSNQTLWVSQPVTADEGLLEERWDFPAHSKHEIPLQNYQGLAFLRLETLAAKDLKINWRNNSSETSAQLPWGVSNELTLHQGLAHTTMWLTNTTAFSQQIRLLDAVNGREYAAWTLAAYETRPITSRANSRTNSRTRTLASAGLTGPLKLVGESRIAAIAHDDLWMKALSLKPLMSSFRRSPSGTLFEVSSVDGSQAFLVEINDPSLISAAREQIRDPKASLPRLLIAKVAVGNHLINQDLKGAYRAPWSWHIEQVFRFADFASIDCDGSPALVEKTLPWWLAAKGGLICFWGYRITREL